MAAKCNIPSKVLLKAQQLAYGLSCPPDDTDNAIIENYIEYLACDDVNVEICHPDNCVNDPVELTCENFKVNSITFQRISTNPLEWKFSVNSSNITNGNTPFTCDWSYSTDKFDLIADNGCELILRLKSNVDTSGTSKITVTVTDSLECEAEKTCYFTDSSIDCSDGFKDCPADIDLVVLPYVLGTPNLVFTWNRIAGDVINFAGLIDGTFDVIDWGDGVINTLNHHTYNTTGSYTVKFYNSNATYCELRNDIGPSVYKITAVTTLPDTLIYKLGFDNNSIITLPSLSGATGLQAIIVKNNDLTTFPTLAANTAMKQIDVSNNNLATATINTMLITLDGHGLNNGIFRSSGQTPAAPPSGGGATAAANLITKGWTVVTD